jgi:hypothetical protein
VLNVADCQQERVGCTACEPLVTHAHVVVLNVAVCQHERPVGATACVPLTTQEQFAVLNVAVCQQETVGCTACEPLVTHEHAVVLNVDVCQHERPVGCAGAAVTVTVADPMFPEPVPPPVTDEIVYVEVDVGLTAMLIGLEPVAE